MSLLIHIGLHKTGTTWLQDEVLAKWACFNPIGEHGGMSLVTHALYDEDQRYLSPFEIEVPRLQAAAAPYLARATEGQCSVLSHERLSGYPHSGAFDARTIADRLRWAFPESRILIVVREQRSMILSLYYHYLKNGGGLSLSDYLRGRSDGKHPAFRLPGLRYVDLIDYYDALFTRDRVLVLPYEMLRAQRNEFLDRICDFCEVSPDRTMIPGEARNVSDPYHIVSRFPALNHLVRRTSLNEWAPLGSASLAASLKGGLLRRVVRRLNRRLPSATARREVFQDVIRGEVGTLFQDSNGRLQDRMECDLSEYGYDLPTP